MCVQLHAVSNYMTQQIHTQFGIDCKYTNFKYPYSLQIDREIDTAFNSLCCFIMLFSNAIIINITLEKEETRMRLNTVKAAERAPRITFLFDHKHYTSVSIIVNRELLT